MTGVTHRGHRSMRTALQALLALLAILAALQLGTPSPPARAQPPTEPEAGTRIELLAQTPWVAPQGTFELRLRVSDAPPDARLAIDVHPAVSSRSRFSDTIRAQSLGSPLRPGPPSWPLNSLAREDGTYQVVVPVGGTETPPFGVRLSSAGVYPVSISVVDPEGKQAARLVTHLIRLPRSGSSGVPLALSLIVPLEARSPFRPDGSLQLTSTDRNRLSTTISALSRTPDVAVSLVPSPETVDALAVAREEGTDLLATLARALPARQVLARPYAPIDLAAWARAAPSDADADIGLTRQLATGTEVVAAQLGIWPDSDTWLADQHTDPTALSRLRDAGVSQVVVPADRIAGPQKPSSPADLLAFEMRTADGAALRAVTTDGLLAQRLLATTDPVLNAHLVLADLAILALERPTQSRGVVLVPPDGVSIPSETWDALLGGLSRRSAPEANPLVSPVTVDDLFRVIDTATSTRGGARSVLVRELAPTSTDVDVGPIAAASATTWSRIDSFASMLDTPPSPTASGSATGGTDQPPTPSARELVWPMRRHVLAAAAIDLDEPTRDAHLAAADQAVDAKLAAITLPEPQQVTLTERTGRIPLTFENQLDHAVTLKVVLESDKLEFSGGAVQLVTLPPKTTTRHEVEVTARSSGAFPLKAVVRSPDDGLVLGSTRLSVRSTAISGIGLLLSAVAGGFLLLWWARHFRDVRRSRRLVSPHHPSARAAEEKGAPTPAAGSATLPDTVSAESAISRGSHARSTDRH
jgi:hypothetical protein